MSPRLFSLLLATAGGLALLSAPIRAQDAPTSFSMELPFQANAATPFWLGHPATPTGELPTLDLPLQPPDATSALLVTVYFQEKDGGFLRIVWNGPDGAQTLSRNFYEGIDMSNQRSLLISPETLAGGGTLELQSGDATLGVERIRFQWLQTHQDLAAPDIDETLVIPAPGATLLAHTLDGQPPQDEGQTWQGQLVDLPLTDTPQRIEQGVEFDVDVDHAPIGGRIVLKENGLPWGQHLVVWVNRRRVGTITPVVPNMADTGFPRDATSAAIYVGWREGSAFVPVSFLLAGENTLQFSAEDDSGSGPASAANANPLPLAVKDVVLQLSYPDAGDTPPTPVSSDSSSSPTTIPTPEPDLSIPGAYSQAAHPTSTP